jgi:hypothetical protein
VLAPQRVLFRNTCNRKRLARKTYEQDIMFRNLVDTDSGNIAVWRMIVAEICSVGLLRIFVPFGGENAVPADVAAIDRNKPIAASLGLPSPASQRCTWREL